MDITQIVAVIIGVTLLLVLLFLVFWRRHLTTAEYTFARIIMALAVSCVAVVITGFLQIEIKGFIQAGGALAVFVIVYFYAPAALPSDEKWEDIVRRWRNMRDIHDEETRVNLDDVVRALRAVNDTAKILDNDGSLIDRFKKEFRDDYLILYGKLKSNDYELKHLSSSSSKLLENQAHSLADKLGV